MAATAWVLTPAEQDLINSLSVDELPAKLRCAICSRVAINAYKLPCCEQPIDEKCHATLPSTCPVCEHSPLSSADCITNKAMRFTIKAFVKTALKQREAANRAKDSTEATPATPVESTPAPTATALPTKSATPPVEKSQENGPEPSKVQPDDHATAEGVLAVDEASGGVTEEHEGPPSPKPENNDDREDGTSVDIGKLVADELAKDQATKATSATDLYNEEQNTQSGQFGNGFDQNNGQFPNQMNFTGDYGQNQMQMMMAMQNGMMPGSFQFPMMGMDPMMQNMYMNGGFGTQGMGMNGMNMMGGGFGTGSDNWNGQQTWNNGQDNFNHPNALGNGDYGSFNSGFQTGYNQRGNFGHQNQYGYSRGYGRGRFQGRGHHGGYGRGGYGNHYGARAGFQDQGFSNQHHGYQNQALDNSQADHQESSAAAGDVDEFGRTKRLEDKAPSDQPEDLAEASTADPEAAAATAANGSSREDLPKDASAAAGGDLALRPIPSLDEVKSSQQDRGDLGHGQVGQFRGDFRGHGGNMGPPIAPDVPLNAPSGPKAMRLGLPNTSVFNLRAHGFQVDNGEIRANGAANPSSITERLASGRSQSRSIEPVNQISSHRERSRSVSRSRSIEPVKRTGSYRERSRSRSRSRDREAQDRAKDKDRREGRDRSRDRDRDRGRSASPSRSQSRSRKSTDYRKRRRSESADDRDEDRHRHGKHRSSRKHGDDDDKHERRRTRDKEDDRERDRKRSHRDKDRERDRDRRDRDRDRDRDRERDRDKDRSDRRDRKDRDRDRDREKDRERDRERRHSKKSSEHRSAAGEPPKDPRAHRKSIDIRSASGQANETADSSSRRASQSTAPAANDDPYAAERERSSRNRLLAESQKLAAMSSLAGGSKRRSDDTADEGRRSRRKGRRGEVVSTEDINDRLKRGEEEREGRRR